MAVTTVTSRELNQDIGRAKRAAKAGPVIITDRGAPSFVLLSFDEFERIKGKSDRSIIEMLAMPPGVEDIELDLPERRDYSRPVDLD